jgi:hypothetical protein
MFRKTLIGLTLALSCSVSVARAQAQWKGFTLQEQDHKAEFGIIGGYVWTTSKDFYTTAPVNADIASSEFYGVELDVNVRPGTQLVLLWTRQDTEFKLKGLGIPSGTPSSTDVAVEYWQIGAISGAQKGKVMPYGKFTLGATRYAIDSALADDEWQFSMIFGIGAKMYPNEKIAIRFEAGLPFTFINGGVSAGVGTGGAGVYIGGSGISQWTLSLGVNVLLGSK